MGHSVALGGSQEESPMKRTATAFAAALLATVLSSGGAHATPDAPFDPSGTWTIVDAAGIASGTLALAPAAEAGSYSVLRTAAGGSRSGQATFLDGNLVVVFDSSVGIVRKLDDDDSRGAGLVDPYAYDPSESAFRGTHAGAAESLRRALTGNSVELLVDGKEMFPAFLEAIEAARSSIHIESYIWADDASGRAVAQALIERAHAGVKVRAIFDAVGCEGSERLETDLRHGGVEVLVYNRLGLGSLGETVSQVADVALGSATLEDVPGKLEQGLDNRDHRKALVVDGRVAFLGGICLRDDSIGDWHDVHSRVRGPAVALVQRHFVESWLAGGGSAPDETDLFPVPVPAGDLLVDVPTTVPGVRDEIKRVYLSRIAQARTEVFLETPYFADDETADALVAAAGRGVHVTLILPRDVVNDVKIAATYHALVRIRLEAAGVELRDYPRMCHGKIAAIDGTWATVGSCNLDNRSFTRNLEENFSVDDARFAAAMKTRVFDPDVAASTRWSSADHPRSLLDKVEGWFVSKLTGWL
jgi:cardiolipin synthase